MSTITQSRKDLNDLSLLVVDPNDHIRLMYRHMVEEMGCRRFTGSRDSALALELVPDLNPDVLLIEWTMRPLDGIAFTRLLRNAVDSPNPYVPVIMVTANTETKKMMEARDAGVSEFVTKPVTARTLRARILHVLDRPRQFIRSLSYVGPDRRRASLVPYLGLEHRTSFDPTPFNLDTVPVTG